MDAAPSFGVSMKPEVPSNPTLTLGLGGPEKQTRHVQEKIKTDKKKLLMHLLQIPFTGVFGTRVAHLFVN